MVSTEDGEKFERTELKELHKMAVEHLLYMHGDVWRGQQFYTSLNSSIIGFAVLLLKVGSGSSDATVILFVAGAVTALFGLLTARKLRIYYLQAYEQKVFFDNLLHHHSRITDSGFGRRTLAVGWSHIPTAEDLQDPSGWVRKNVWRRGGVTFFFMVLQLVFFAIDVSAALLVLAGLL